MTSHRLSAVAWSPSVTVLDAGDIELSGKSGLAELLRLVPGVDVVRSGGPGSQASLFMRGTESDHALVLLDGVPLNDPRSGGVDIGHLDIAAVERVEVIRGPQATVRGAPGGVIHIVSKSGGTPYAGLRLDHRLGHHFSAGAATSSLPLSLYGHVLSHAADGISAAAGGSERDGFHSGQLRAGAVWRGDELLLRSELNWIGSSSDLDDYVAAPVDDPDYRRHRRQWQFSLAAQHRSDRLLQQWSLSRHVLRDSFKNGVAAQDSFLDGSIQRFRGNATTFSWTGMLQQQWLRSGTAVLHGGMELQHNDGREASFARSVFEQALWLQQDIDTGVVQLGIGGRLQRHQHYGRHGDVHLALAVPVASWKFSVAYGSGYRAPAISELAHPLYGNPGLSPERTRSMTLGLSYDGDDYRLWAEHFLTYLRHRIDYDFASMRLRNAGRASVAGLELGGSYYWSQYNLGVDFHATRTDASDSASGRRLLRRPLHKWQLRVHKTIGRFELSADTRFVGQRLDTGGPLPSHTVLDANLSWRASSQVLWSLRLDNILNRDYQEIQGYSAPGRELFLALQLRGADAGAAAAAVAQ